jgi:hypothetical protein
MSNTPKPTIHTFTTTQNIHRMAAMCEADDRLARHAFRVGASHCREMLADFVANSGDPGSDYRVIAGQLAASIRANWNPEWGKDPGPPSFDTE